VRLLTLGRPVRVDLPSIVRRAPTAVEPGAVQTGTGYRGVARHKSIVIWRCPHVHFTEHSARACAAGRLASYLAGEAA
jgi:hypothetical protein